MELQTIKVLMVGRVVRDESLAELMSAADGFPPLSACWEEQEISPSAYRISTSLSQLLLSLGSIQQRVPRVKSERCSNFKPHLIYWGIGATSRKCVELHPT